jgi:hypothetical protein
MRNQIKFVLSFFFIFLKNKEPKNNNIMRYKKIKEEKRPLGEEKEITHGENDKS